MKKGLLTTLVTGASVLMLSPSLLALQIQTGSNFGPYQQNVTVTKTGSGSSSELGGGEFTVHLSGGNVALPPYTTDTANITGTTGLPLTTFQTFCLEVNEGLAANSTYDALFNSKAVNGGAGGGPNDPISQGTAWLYRQFATGSLANYAYGTAPIDAAEVAARKTTAGELQRMIWWLEDEITDLPSSFSGAGSVLDLEQALKDEFGDLATAQLDDTGAYGVSVLNLKQGSLNRQDILILVPDSSTTLILLGLSLFLVPIARRYRILA